MKRAVVLGTFDGLHSGHRAVIGQAEGYEIIAVTFEIPPKAVAGDKARLLMTPERRYEALRSLGVSQVVPLKFEEVRDMPPEEFLELLMDCYKPSLIACGFNYRFGRGAVGDAEWLSRYCAQNGIVFKCCDAVLKDGNAISSSVLREKLLDGDIRDVNAEVYGGFSFKAPVITGDRRGRTLGFPTINQKYPDVLAPIKHGVYAVKVRFDGKTFDGISNIGHRPTFETTEVFSETYIKDFSGDLYGCAVEIFPQRFLREERRFSSKEELKRAISADVASISEN